MAEENGILVSEEGVALLNSMADTIENGAEVINGTANKLVGDMESYKALGPHRDGIIKVVEYIENCLKEITADSYEFGRKLRHKAELYQMAIDMGGPSKSL